MNVNKVKIMKINLMIDSKVIVNNNRIEKR